MHTAQALGLEDHAVEHCEHVVDINVLEAAIRLLFENHGGEFFAVLDHWPQLQPPRVIGHPRDCQFHRYASRTSHRDGTSVERLQQLGFEDLQPRRRPDIQVDVLA